MVAWLPGSERGWTIPAGRGRSHGNRPPAGETAATAGEIGSPTKIDERPVHHSSLAPPRSTSCCWRRWESARLRIGASTRMLPTSPPARCADSGSPARKPYAAPERPWAPPEVGGQLPAAGATAGLSTRPRPNASERRRAESCRSERVSAGQTSFTPKRSKCRGRGAHRVKRPAARRIGGAGTGSNPVSPTEQRPSPHPRRRPLSCARSGGSTGTRGGPVVPPCLRRCLRVKWPVDGGLSVACRRMPPYPDDRAVARRIAGGAPSSGGLQASAPTGECAFVNTDLDDDGAGEDDRVRPEQIVVTSNARIDAFLWSAASRLRTACRSWGGTRRARTRPWLSCPPTGVGTGERGRGTSATRLSPGGAPPAGAVRRAVAPEPARRRGAPPRARGEPERDRPQPAAVPAGRAAAPGRPSSAPTRAASGRRLPPRAGP
jgi:hypothetical protein